MVLVSWPSDLLLRVLKVGSACDSCKVSLFVPEPHVSLKWGQYVVGLFAWVVVDVGAQMHIGFDRERKGAKPSRSGSCVCVLILRT